MNSYEIALDYTEITDAEDEILGGHRAFAQFAAEFALAAREVPHLVGYRFARVFVEDQRTNVTLTIDGPALDTTALVDLLQRHLYDEGDLSGSFVVGAYRTFKVVYSTPGTVLALDASEAIRTAEKTAPVGATLTRIDPV